MKMVNLFIAKNASQTKKLGEELAKKILRSLISRRQLGALVLALEGELGSGKTTFLQGFARGLGVKGKILSPTFIIVRKLQITNHKLQTIPNAQNYKFKTFYHIDCYRLKKSKELLGLGFKKIIADLQNIVAVEWADRVKKILPKKVVWLKFEFIGKNARKITIK